MQSLLKNIIIIVGFLAIAAIGYYLFIANKSNDLATGGGVTLGSPAAQSQAFLSRLQDIKNIQLSDELFFSPIFTSLKDFSTPVEPTDVGRSLPFEDPQ